MEGSLVCQSFKSVIITIKKVAIMINIVVALLLFFTSICGGFSDYETGLLFSSAILFVSMPLLIPGFLYEKVSESSVVISHEDICVFDKNGCCWRRIPLDLVTNIQIRDVAGFFYGNSRFYVKEKYICLFLNGTKSIPNVSFNKLFHQKDFLMISHKIELENYITDILVSRKLPVCIDYSDD